MGGDYLEYQPLVAGRGCSLADNLLATNNPKDHKLNEVFKTDTGTLLKYQFN